jgi:hypothetical protein
MSCLSEQKIPRRKLFSSVFYPKLSYSYKPRKPWLNMDGLKIGKKTHATRFSKGFFAKMDIAGDLPGIKYKED